LQFPPLRSKRRGTAHFSVRQFDSLTEMGDRFLEGRPAERRVARLAPPFDGQVVEPGLPEMMGDDFGLSRRALLIVAQEFGGPSVQRLPTAFEQAVVGGILDQRMLEAISGLRRRTLD
jgi:hypothetical protein